MGKHGLINFLFSEAPGHLKVFLYLTTDSEKIKRIIKILVILNEPKPILHEPKHNLRHW